MLDPLTALSVAATVVQFVDFGSKLVSKGKEFYKSPDGVLLENAELEDASGRLQGLSRSLEESLYQFVGPLTERDQRLELVVKSCRSIAAELDSRLQKLKLAVPTGKRHSKRKSFRQALKSVWSKEEVMECAERLRELRSELEIHVIIGLREDVNIMAIEQTSRFQSLDHEIRIIIPALIKTRCDSVDRKVHSIVPAVVHNRKALQETMTSQFHTLGLAQQAEHEKTRTALIDHDEERRKDKIRIALLESLRFPTMNYRHESISEAYTKTFEWIFRRPEDALWHDFVKWLETGTGIYWINGKPGSGKSTLMKFVVEQEQTRGHLEKWALEEPWSILPSSSGAAASQSSDPVWGFLVFPDEWKSQLRVASHDMPISFNKWSLSRLKKAFKRLIEHSSEHLRVCFFIDGLDEYEGDYEEIAEYFLMLSDESPYVKFCISSRPEVAFREAFKNMPKLRLQDLTSDDIQRYIKDHLKDKKRMVLLSMKSPKDAEELVTDLNEKAEGVFLWVTLVTRELLKGLRNQDSISILRDRLKAIPADLDGLYAKMLASVEPRYRGIGSKIFRLYNAALSLDIESLYRSLIADAAKALAAPVNLSQSQPESKISSFDITSPGAGFGGNYDLDRLLQYMETIVYTRCGGLLEINGKPEEYKELGEEEDPFLSQTTFHVEYIHRTARDFVRSPQIWRTLLTWISNFDPYMTLLITEVLAFKTNCYATRRTDGHPKGEMTLDDFEDPWRIISGLARRTKEANFVLQELLLDEFDRASVILYGADWTRLLFPNNREPDFLCAALHRSLFEYVKRKLAKNPLHVRRESGIPLLAFVLFPYLPDYFQLNEALNMLVLLFGLGAHPNEIYNGHSMWQYIIHHVHTECGVFVKFSKFLRLMLEHGADPNVCCMSDVQDLERLYGEHDFSTYIKGRVVKHTSNTRFEGRPFNEAHSLESIIRYCSSEYRWDVKEADELIALVAKLRAQKESELQERLE